MINRFRSVRFPENSLGIIILASFGEALSWFVFEGECHFVRYQRGLLKRMEVTPTIQNLKTMSLEDRLEYPAPPTMAPAAISLADQIFESNRASHYTQESGPSISQFDTMIPPPVPHMPTASKRQTAKKPKKVVVA